MGRPRGFDEKKALDRAAVVFSQYGYEGATMAALTSAMGLNAPSIYAAFGSKRDLFAAALERCGECDADYHAWILEAPTAREVVERLLFGAVEQLSRKDAPLGALLLIQAGLRAGPENADVPEMLARRRRENEQTLRDRFEQSKRSGDLAPDADPGALASFVIAVLDGLMVRAAAGADEAELRAIAEQAMATWRGLAPMPAQAEERPAGGRGRPREFKPKDALAAAMEVFWQKGYAGASLADLTEAMGISRPSLYAAFGNKQSLFLKALDRYQAENLAYVREALEEPTVRGFVERILVGALAAQLDERCPGGCLAMTSAMQGGDEGEEVRAELRRRAEEGHRAFVARLERGKAEGELPASADPEGLARLLGSLVQGIATLGTTGAPESQLRALVDSAFALWPKAETYRQV